MTIHKFAAKLKKQSQINFKDLFYILIDEVSMLGGVYFKLLMTIQKIRPDIR